MIDLEKIVKIYKLGDVEVTALDGVTCRIETGEMVSIMGPSGSGKSTLMNLIGCLDRPTSGKYELDGIDVSRLKDDQLADIRNKKIGFVFQTFNLLGQLSALGNVELGLRYAGLSRQGARDALARVGLAERLSHRPTELSGGEQQRVAIARALAKNPPLILADEPTGNLDSRSGAEIISILKNLHAEQGITVITITHDPGIAHNCQRIIHISDGQVVSEERT